MRNLAIIPARGGSKRIPRKNIKIFLGKPIIAYSIETALETGLFEEVMVSTDDNEIADVAKEYGATVPFLRTQENADDFATLSDVIEEVKDCYNRDGKKFDNICCILPTSPLLNSQKLKEGYNFLIENKVDSVKPIVRFSYPIQRALKTVANSKIEMFWPENSRIRSQDLEPSFFDAGQFYWMNFEKGLIGANKYGIEISELECQDIDTIEDWMMAELKFKLREKNASQR